MNKQLLYSLLLVLFPFFGYSQTPVIAAPAGPLQGGTQAMVGAFITGAPANTTYTVTITCSGCTPDTKNIITNGSGIGIDGTFLVTLPEINGPVTMDGTFTGTNCSPCTATASTSTAVFPVELVRFEAEERSEQIQLNWETASEVNNSHFDILHGEDGKTFEKIGQVQGMGTTDEWTTYEFTHRLPVSGSNYYQLKQIDYNGQYELSEIIIFEWKEDVSSQINIYPNPTAQHIDINSNTEMTGIQIINSKGQIIQSLQQNVGYQYRIDLDPQVTDGIYMVKIEFGNGEHQLQKLLVRR